MSYVRTYSQSCVDWFLVCCMLAYSSLILKAPHAHITFSGIIVPDKSLFLCWNGTLISQPTNQPSGIVKPCSHWYTRQHTALYGTGSHGKLRSHWRHALSCVAFRCELGISLGCKKSTVETLRSRRERTVETVCRETKSTPSSSVLWMTESTSVLSWADAEGPRDAVLVCPWQLMTVMVYMCVAVGVWQWRGRGLTVSAFRRPVAFVVMRKAFVCRSLS